MSVIQNTNQNIYPLTSLLTTEELTACCGYVDNFPFLLRLLVTLVHKMRKTEGPTMNPADANRILELAASIWPNVRDTLHSREAWYLALAKTNLYDALDAVGSLARDRKTVHVSDVVKRAAAIRESLLRSLPPIPDPPVELADDPQAEILWIRTARERQLHDARMLRQSVPA